MNYAPIHMDCKTWVWLESLLFSQKSSVKWSLRINQLVNIGIHNLQH
jgi:hypothetical protein